MWLLRGWPGGAVGVQLPGGVGVGDTDCAASAPLGCLAIGGTTGDGRTVGTGVGMTATLASTPQAMASAASPAAIKFSRFTVPDASTGIAPG